MKVTVLIGKRVLDEDAIEIGRIEDLDVDLKENTIKNVIINAAERSIRRDKYEVTSDMIDAVGDYVLLNVPRNELIDPEIEEKKIEDVEIVDPNSLGKD